MKEWPTWMPTASIMERWPQFQVYQAARPARRPMGQSARRARAVSLRKQQGHADSHPWHQRAVGNRGPRVLGLHPHARHGRDRPLWPGACRHAGGGDQLARHRNGGSSKLRSLRECSVSSLALQEADRCDADLQMLADGALVEGVRGAGQLDLAMQRLVGDAKQRAVGHAHAKALGGDGRQFHVDGDGARDIDAPALLRPAQFPVAVVVGDDGAGAQAPLQRFAAVACDLGRPPPAARPALRRAPESASSGGTASSRMLSCRR